LIDVQQVNFFIGKRDRNV